FLPATSVGYGGGKGKNSALAIPSWSSLFSSTTQWNGLFDLTVIAFDRSGNGSIPSAGNFDIENAYATKVFITHVCDPSRTGCTLGDAYLCFDKDCPITAGTAESDITVTVTYPQ